MDLSFYPLTLEAIDQADAEALCLFVGEDERPLTGLSGLADWRLAGGLSRMLRRGLVTGSMGEALLTPGSRLGFRKLFLFGLGPVGRAGAPGSETHEEELCARVADCVRRLHLAGVEDAAMQLPARLPLDLGIRTLIDEPLSPARALVFGPDPAALVRALSHAATRGQGEARHERRVIKVPGPPRPQPPVRQGLPPRAPTLEMPKASPLPFAPSVSRGTAGNASAPVVAAAPVAQQPAPVAPAAAAPEKATPLPVTAPAAPAAAKPQEPEVPFAPPVPDSEPTAPLAPVPQAGSAQVAAAAAALPLSVAERDAAPSPPAAAAPGPAAPIVAPSAPAAAPAKATPESAPTAAQVAVNKALPAPPAPKGPPPPQVPVELPKSDAARALETRAPVPVDHKAPRFKPPNPTKKGGDKKG